MPVRAGCCHTYSFSAASLSCLLAFSMALIHSSYSWTLRSLEGIFRRRSCSAKGSM